MKRRNSYIIINIHESNEMEYIEKTFISNTIKRINKEQTLYKIIMDTYYYYFTMCLTFLYFKFKFFKKFKTTDVVLFHNKTKYHNADQKTDILFYDDGVIINSLFVPYENIIRFAHENNEFYISIFGKISNFENNFKLELGHKLVDLVIVSDASLQIFNNIKSYLYYHIKHNKMDSSIVKIYFKKNV